jgi:hypothetical protein
MIKAILILAIVKLLGLGGLAYLVYLTEKRMKSWIDAVGIQIGATEVGLRQYIQLSEELLEAKLRARTELLIKTQGELTDSLRETIVEVGKVVVGHSDVVKAHSQALLDSAHTNEVSPRRVVSR